MSLKQKEYLRHELLDRLNSCLVIVDELVASHVSVIQKTKAFTEVDRELIKMHISVATESLSDAYQLVGKIHL